MTIFIRGFGLKLKASINLSHKSLRSLEDFILLRYVRVCFCNTLSSQLGKNVLLFPLLALNPQKSMKTAITSLEKCCYKAWSLSASLRSRFDLFCCDTTPELGLKSRCPQTWKFQTCKHKSVLSSAQKGWVYFFQLSFFFFKFWTLQVK